MEDCSRGGRLFSDVIPEAEKRSINFKEVGSLLEETSFRLLEVLSLVKNRL